MKTPAPFLRLFVLATATAPLTALAHPGHDGDHGLVWDFGHLAAHPLATISCVLLFGAIGWTVWRALRTSANRPTQTEKIPRQDR